ncbi:MAG: phosphoribosyltransferase family protein [Nitrososphaerota archaeon]|nr:phosphoribosyltransferase family protein [Nitrososphaerota archaeon]
MSRPRLEQIKRKINLISLLNVVKNSYTYHELSQITGLPITVLARYAKGHVLPSDERVNELYQILTDKVPLEEIILSRLVVDESGYFDSSHVIWDVDLLRLVSQKVASLFAGKNIDKVMTAAVDGIPLASFVAEELGADIVIAKRYKEVGVKDFLEITYVIGSSAVVSSLYIPKNSLKKDDSVLIVDDAIRTGETDVALIKLAEKAKANIVGLFILIATGRDWRERLQKETDAPIYVLAEMSPKNILEVNQRKFTI